jgi:hypothetical protein
MPSTVAPKKIRGPFFPSFLSSVSSVITFVPFAGPSTSSVKRPSVTPIRAITGSIFSLPGVSSVSRWTRPVWASSAFSGGRGMAFPSGPFSGDGLKRSAALGRRATPFASRVFTVTVAVMPGRSLRSGFSTSITAMYVTTPCTVFGA